MAGNSGNRFLGGKKRTTAQLHGLRPHHGRDNREDPPGISPPNKRSKSFDVTDFKETEDSFGYNEEFTADDLEEIDIIASQALTRDLDCKVPLNTNSASRSSSPSTARSCSQSVGHLELSKNDSTVKYSLGIPKFPEQDGLSRSKNLSEKSREKIPAKDVSEFEKLKAQHEKLKEKMKAMQEEILIKNGEIKILRDSLHHTESNLEEKKRSHFLLEQEKIQALNDKEKEFSKKLQSLQSELQFKDAEMNELRTKLQNSGKASKAATTLSISHVSPRKSPSRVIKPEACSPQIGKSSFPTKESFSANTSPPHSCQPSTHSQLVLLVSDDKNHNLGNESVKQEKTQRNLTSSCIQRLNTQGSVLINLLLKQPLTPEASLGLCHLLSSHPEAPAGFFQPPRLGSASSGTSSIQTTYSREGSFSASSLREAQSLAITGLNLIARDEGPSDEGLTEGNRRPSQVTQLCQLPGAVHLLPLVRYYTDLYCQTLQALATVKRNSSGDSSACSSRVSTSVEANTEDSLSALEGFTVVALGILQHLVCYSGAVVQTLLSVGGRRDATDGEDPALGENKNPVCRRSHGKPSENPMVEEQPAENPEETVNSQNQHPLLKMLLHLLSFSSASTGHLQVRVLNQCLKVLVKLAENCAFDLLPRFQCVLSSHGLLQCLSSRAHLSAVLLTVHLLSLLGDHEKLAPQLCSQSETCLLLLLYMYITSRPDKAAVETQWFQLEQETVWFLAKIMQSPDSPISIIGSDCQCSLEVVKALIVMLHRQWLTIRRLEGLVQMGQRKQMVRCLRDTLLLLHSLSQRDTLFHVHCMDVLHQYDQVIPGIQALLRGLPDRTNYEETALEDLCRTEPDLDDPDTDPS
ncbi:ATR-interacting protein [Phascolarctos cinereus]|uniref:ATR-interacting protein n=1 Tax=Phascolarctos cinereus TaxID=38626 RepID=A0A6P5LAD7_PHACI|nr:ATR-interacting protein [Phascolarctos cinereus]